MSKETNEVIIEKIRESIKQHNASIFYGDMGDTLELVNELTNTSLIVWDTEDRGDRWTQWDIRIYKVPCGDNYVYFKIEEEEGKTERQNGDYCVIVSEVEPYKTVVVKYREVSHNDKE